MTDRLCLSLAESRKLMDSVDAWCDRTGTNYSRIVIAAGVGVTTRSAVRNRGTRITQMTAQRIRKALKDHPNGISAEDHRARLQSTVGEAKLDQDAIASRRVDRDPCPFCGVRRDFGCEHIPSGENGVGWVRYG